METEKEAEAVDVFKQAKLGTANLLPDSRHGEMTVAGSRLIISCSAETKEDARTWASAVAARFGRLISMKIGQHFTAVFTGLDSVPGEAGQSILAPLVHSWWVETYDTKKVSDDVEASGLACSLDDPVLDRALTYFQRGLFYRRVVWRHVDPRWPDPDFTVSAATLNFCKAAAQILGNDRDGRRSHSLGVARDLRRRIQQLYNRRSTQDVAHPTLDAGAIQQLRDTVYASQEIAQKVIEAYIAFRRHGGTLPPAGPSTRRRRRK